MARTSTSKELTLKNSCKPYLSENSILTFDSTRSRRNRRKQLGILNVNENNKRIPTAKKLRREKRKLEAKLRKKEYRKQLAAEKREKESGTMAMD